MQRQVSWLFRFKLAAAFPSLLGLKQWLMAAKKSELAFGIITPGITVAGTAPVSHGIPF